MWIRDILVVFKNEGEIQLKAVSSMTSLSISNEWITLCVDYSKYYPRSRNFYFHFDFHLSTRCRSFVIDHLILFLLFVDFFLFPFIEIQIWVSTDSPESRLFLSYLQTIYNLQTDDNWWHQFFPPLLSSTYIIHNSSLASFSNIWRKVDEFSKLSWSWHLSIKFLDLLHKSIFFRRFRFVVQ